MKSLVVIAVSLVFVVSSCGYTERDFLGKWNVVNAELQSEWRDNKVKDSELRYFKSISYEFLSDGKLVYHEGKREVEGTWELTRGEYLNVKYSWRDGYYGYNEDDLAYKIISCTGGKMALSVSFKENETWILYLEEEEE